MRFADLLRATVFLLAAEASALGIAAMIVAIDLGDSTLVLGASAWWGIAIVTGIWTGRRSRRPDSIRQLMATARTATSLPAQTPSRIALQRLWPFGAVAVVCAALTPLLPSVPAFAAGLALLYALAWRNHEAMVTAVEDRDGVAFYVDEGSAFEPIRLLRTPGLRRDLLRDAAGAEV